MEMPQVVSAWLYDNADIRYLCPDCDTFGSEDDYFGNKGHDCRDCDGHLIVVYVTDVEG